MLKRALFFSTPYCLSLRNEQMIIHTKGAPDTQKSVPIEDVGVVVLEHQQTTVTLPLLNALSDNNVAVILCGDNRMPNAMLMNTLADTRFDMVSRPLDVGLTFTSASLAKCFAGTRKKILYPLLE